MRKASPSITNLAGRLLETQGVGEHATPETPGDAFQRRYEAVRRRLTELVGSVGFRALLTRALALASAEVPWFRAVQVDADGELAGLAAVLAARDPAEARAGCLALLAHLLGLLVALVGPELTSPLLDDAWPDVPMNAADFATDEGEG